MYRWSTWWPPLLSTVNLCSSAMAGSEASGDINAAITNARDIFLNILCALSPFLTGKKGPGSPSFLDEAGYPGIE